MVFIMLHADKPPGIIYLGARAAGSTPLDKPSGILAKSNFYLTACCLMPPKCYIYPRACAAGSTPSHKLPGRFYLVARSHLG